jgi:phosphatidylethanolamine-binding protein (PEBP) family uncharacterized protein
MDDPDAPVGTWVHWVLYDLPPTRPGFRKTWRKRQIHFRQWREAGIDLAEGQLMGTYQRK